MKEKKILLSTLGRIRIEMCIETASVCQSLQTVFGTKKEFRRKVNHVFETKLSLSARLRPSFCGIGAEEGWRLGPHGSRLWAWPPPFSLGLCSSNVGHTVSLHLPPVLWVSGSLKLHSPEENTTSWFYPPSPHMGKQRWGLQS